LLVTRYSSLGVSNLLSFEVPVICHPLSSLCHLSLPSNEQLATSNIAFRLLRKPIQSRRMIDQNLRVSYCYALITNFTYKEWDYCALRVVDFRLKEEDDKPSVLTLHSWSEGGALASNHTAKCR